MLTQRGWKAIGVLVLVLGIWSMATLGNGTPRTILVEAVRPGLKITVDKGCGATYYTDETLNVTVRSRMSGYLTLYDFTPDGLVHQIFPNQYYEDNHIQAETDYSIPGNLLPFIFRVAPPAGEEILFGIVTDRPYEFLPDEFFDFSQALPQITLSDDAAAQQITESLGILPSGYQAAVGLCFFDVAVSEESPPPVFDFSLSAEPDTLETEQGGAASTTVHAWKLSGEETSVTIQVTGVPSGVSASPSSWTWSLGDERRVVQFDIESDVPSGTYDISIVGSTESVTRTATVALTVGAPPVVTESFDFSVSADPGDGEALQGDTVSTIISARRTEGDNTRVSFKIMDLPSGVTATPSSWHWTLGEESRSVTFSVAENAAIGTHTITVQGTGDGVSRSTRYTLRVEAPPQPKSQGEVYALFVAISDYEGEDNDFSCPVMQDTVGLMQDTLGGYFDHTRQLNDTAATRARILDTMRSFFGQAGSQDTVYFHFAGHGTQVDDEDGDEADGQDEVIASYDCEFILDDEIWDLISDLEASRAILVFESCHSGTAYRGIAGTSLYSPPGGSRGPLSGGTMIDDLHQGARAASGPALLALQAASADESAWLWCRHDGSTGLTFFAEGMVDAFTETQDEADTNGDGWISFQEAFRFAEDYVGVVVGDAVSAGDLPAGTTQTPQMYDGIEEAVNVVEVE